MHAKILFRRIIFNKCPPYLLNKIKLSTVVHTLNLRYRGHIWPPPHRTTFFRRSFTYQINKLYYPVPSNFRLHTDLSRDIKLTLTRKD